MTAAPGAGVPVYGFVTQVSGPLTVLQAGASTAMPAAVAGSPSLSVGQKVLCTLMPDRELIVIGPVTHP